MAPKSKNQKAAAKSYGETRGERRTRLNESTNIEHLHMEMFKQGERIEQLRADLKKKNQDEFALRSLLSSAEADRARAIDTCGGLIRRMRQKISRLKQTIRRLSTDVDAICSSSSDTTDGASGSEGECEDDDEDEESVPLTRRSPKLGSYKKKAGAVAADATFEKYQQRKLVEFEAVVDKLFHSAFGTISVDGAEHSPNTKESHKRGLGAFKWMLERLMAKLSSIWAHLLREKRTVQEAEEAAMARIRNH